MAAANRSHIVNPPRTQKKYPKDFLCVSHHHRTLEDHPGFPAKPQWEIGNHKVYKTDSVTGMTMTVDWVTEQ